MKTQANSILALLAIAERRRDTALRDELLGWIKNCVTRTTAILEPPRPPCMLSIREANHYRRRLVTSLAEGVAGSEPESYIDATGNSLVGAMMFITPVEFVVGQLPTPHPKELEDLRKRLEC